MYYAIMMSTNTQLINVSVQMKRLGEIVFTKYPGEVVMDKLYIAISMKYV